MKRPIFIPTFASASFLVLSAAAALAADLPPDTSKEIPEGSKRPVIVTLPETKLRSPLDSPLMADLPDGLEMVMAAGSPLVTHPIMACLDDRGRLFVGDAVGVNWNKQQLDANPPNRILMLEDTDGDGLYDKSTIFADKMTFPQGGCWLDGSLYVCSPPGLWKLTDTDGDGVADQREMIVSGFDYTGNAADVHGPWLHPNGRLYWCHGRKGHKVIGKEGTVVHEGLACGIWSCQPDGSDVQWHALGCGDNPVKVDFTPDGEIIGVQNLYYSQPRGDTIVHWLYGGVYERADQMKAIEGLPRTLSRMPVMYNFGHVAVSGCCFAKSGALFKAQPLQLLVTYFNTQRVVRMELTPDGATYQARENEFLTLHDPDAHFTDVIEDADGSLLVVNTGGWFRIGCPSSLMAKPDALGAVYRVRKAGPVSPKPLVTRQAPKTTTTPRPELLQSLASSPSEQLQALREIAQSKPQADAVRQAVMTYLAKPLTPELEHAAMFAVLANQWKVSDAFDPASSADLQRRVLKLASEQTDRDAQWVTTTAGKVLDAADPALQATAVEVLSHHGNDPEVVAAVVEGKLALAARQPPLLDALSQIVAELLDKPPAGKLVTAFLASESLPVQQAAVRVLANQARAINNEAWLPPLEKMLAESASPLLLDAIKRLKTNHFDTQLQAIASDAKRPLAIRLKALDSMKGVKLTGDTFAMVKSVLADGASSAAARIQAAAMLANAPLNKEQQLTVAPLLTSLGPVELEKLLPLLHKVKDPDTARAFATELAKSPVIASQQESIYRSLLSSQPPEIFEGIVLPAFRKASEANDAKKRMLPVLAEKAATSGRADKGRELYESGKGTCIACHQIADKGRAIGPNLSKIGAIRTERDLVENILFPSNTLARDYEAHIIETSDGQTTMGVIKSHTAEGLLVVDVAGQEKNIPHTSITGDTTLTTSLMPMGLDQTLPEQELLDLIAYLRSLK